MKKGIFALALLLALAPAFPAAAQSTAAPESCEETIEETTCQSDIDSPLPGEEAAPPVTADYAEELDPQWLHFEAADDEYQLYVLFTASEPVTDLQFLALEFPNIADDGTTDFPGEVLFELPELTPEQPLCVTMVFPGDVPSSGISYVDASGCRRWFAVGQSGFDGSVILSEYVHLEE